MLDSHPSLLYKTGTVNPLKCPGRIHLAVNQTAAGSNPAKGTIGRTFIDKRQTYSPDIKDSIVEIASLPSLFFHNTGENFIINFRDSRLPDITFGEKYHILGRLKLDLTK